jgi:hypothetical protein
MSERRARGTGFIRKRKNAHGDEAWLAIVTVAGRQFSRAIVSRVVKDAEKELRAFIHEVETGAHAAAKVAATN